MKNFLLCLLTIVMIAALCSCEQTPNVVAKTDSLDESIECLGNVNKIYEKSTAKFITGETLLNYKGSDVVFIGKLVEYNSLTKSFADYVETITKEENALMHQNYGVEFNPAKKYVEFCAYVDKQTGIVKEYEIRVFNGDFVYRQGEWYAKSCDFDSTFTRDLSNDVDVDFGFKLGVVALNPAMLPTSEYIYDCSTGKLVDKPSEENATEEITMPEFNETLAEKVMTSVNKIGTVAKIFDDGKVVYETYGSRAYYSCMVEYTSVDDKFSNLFDNAYNSKGGFNAMYRFNHLGFGGRNQVLNEASTYIEVIGEVDSKTGRITRYNLRRIDKEAYKTALNSSTASYYATSIRVSEI